MVQSSQSFNFMLISSQLKGESVLASQTDSEGQQASAAASPAGQCVRASVALMSRQGREF